MNGQLILPPALWRETKIQEGDLLKAMIEEDGSIRLIHLTAEQQELIEQSQLKDIFP